MVAVLDLLNVNVLHSGNLEICVLVGFVAFVSWVSMGACFVYHGQNKMKQWQKCEVRNGERRLREGRRRLLRWPPTTNQGEWGS